MKFEEVIKACSQAYEKTQEQEIKYLMDFLQESLKEKIKPTMSLLSFTSRTECCELAAAFTGTEVSSELVGKIKDGPACVILDYSSKPCIIDASEDDGPAIYGLPCEKLKAQRIAIVSAVTEAWKWLELSGEIDAVCLLLNATMAMNLQERTWLEKFACRVYKDGNLYAAFTKMNALNIAEEVEEVRSVTEGFFSKHGIRGQVLQTPSEALEKMQDFLGGQDTQKIHDLRVSRVVLGMIAGIVRNFVDEIPADGGSIAIAFEQLHKQKKTLELAGEAADGALCNRMKGLTFEVCEGIRDYGRQMSASINSYVAKVPSDKFIDLEDKINSFIRGTWEYYFTSKTGEINERLDGITSGLIDQMDTDVGNLIASLDEQTRRTLYAALKLKASFSMESMYSHIRLQPDSVRIDEITDKLKRETRNMMLLSIPLLFVNPLVSAGNILAAKVAEKFRMSGEMQTMRKEIMFQAENVCFETAENIVGLMQNSFAEETRKASEKVRTAYGALIRHIEDEILKLQAEREKRADAREFLVKQLSETYPKLEAELS